MQHTLFKSSCQEWTQSYFRFPWFYLTLWPTLMAKRHKPHMWWADLLHFSEEEEAEYTISPKPRRSGPRRAGTPTCDFHIWPRDSTTYMCGVATRKKFSKQCKIMSLEISHSNLNQKRKACFDSLLISYQLRGLEQRAHLSPTAPSVNRVSAPPWWCAMRIK